MSTELITLDAIERFDFSLVPEENRERVRELTEQGHKRIRRALDEIIELGRILIEAKELIPYGSFGKWYTSTFQISPDTASRWMKAASGLNTVSEIEPSHYLNSSKPTMPTQLIETTVSVTGYSDEDLQRYISKARRDQQVEDEQKYIATQQELGRANDRITNLSTTSELLSRERREAQAKLHDLEIRYNNGPSQQLRDQLDEVNRTLNRTSVRADNLEAELKRLRDEKIELEKIKPVVVESINHHQVYAGLISKASAAIREVLAYDMPERDNTDWFRVGQLWKDCEGVGVLFEHSPFRSGSQ